MATTAYLFLLAISFVSGTYILVDEKESPLKIPKPSYPRINQWPYLRFDARQFSLEHCLGRYPRFRYDICYQYYKNIKEYLKHEMKSNTLKANTISFMPEILNENNKKVNKPESYINSILDEDKRDASNFNMPDKVLNLTWIEINDPRKTGDTLKSEIAKAEEKDEFVSSMKENITGNGTSSFIAEEKRNGSATDALNMEGETGIQQQTITRSVSSNGVTSRQIEEETTITGEISDVTLTKEATGGKTATEPDHINTVEINGEKIENTHVQEKTTGVFSSEIAEKSTIDSEVTTQKGTDVKPSSTKQNLSTESHSTLTSTELENLNNDTTSASKFTDHTKSESVSTSDADISSSSETESVTNSRTATFPSFSVTESSGYTTESIDGGFTSTMVTDSGSSTSVYTTKSSRSSVTPVVHEHIINIRSIKIAKIVLSVLLLMTGLIAVVMLAVYLFRVRRGAVQYDQLTLLP